MAYEQRYTGRQKIKYNNANDDRPLSYQLVLNGAKVTPASAAITIYSPVSSTAIVSAQAMTVTGTLLTYVVSTTTTASWPVESGYRAEVIVTYSTKTYERQFLFDVCKYILDLGVGFDQLVALDDSIRGMQHDGDADFSALIEACRAIIDNKIESRVLKDDKLRSQMILDPTRLIPAFEYFCHAQIARNNRDWEAHESYSTDFEKALNSALATIQYDADGAGHEPDEIGGLVRTHLVM